MAEFNKAKSLSAAEKYVMQGKIPAAIDEYKKILEKEPHDLTILNTVGDLLLRVNKNEEAIPYFYKLGEAYVTGGFTKNAIAVFKKITRTDAGAIDAILRLADLYLMQGQLSDARGFYQQAMDFYSKRNDAGKCAEVAEKLLMLDPENVSVKQRLATLYEQAGRKDEAAAMYFGVAETYADRANATEAEKMLRKARDLGLLSAEILVLQARIQADGGKTQEAIATLGQVPDLDSHKAALNLLYQAHLSRQDYEAAGEAAAKLFQRHEDPAGLEQLCGQLLESENREALKAFERLADRLISLKNTRPLVDSLKNVIAKDSQDVRRRRLLLRVYESTGETGEYTETAEQLAEVLVKQEEWEGAREIYSKLAGMEPSNAEHHRRMQMMNQKLGRAPAPVAAEPAAPAMPAMAEEFMPDLSAPAAPAPPAEPALDPKSQELLNNALTESELMVNYHQVEKAIEPLERALARLPQNITLNQRLVELYERTERWQQAAERCEALTEAFVMAGDGENATRCGEMGARFREKAGGAAPAVAEFPGVEAFAPPPPPPVQAPAMTEAESGTHEVDLSAQWESMMTVETPAPPPAAAGPAVSNLVEEIDFYLQASMLGEAGATLEKLRAAAPSHPRLDEFQGRIEQATAAAAGITIPEEAPAFPPPEPEAPPPPPAKKKAAPPPPPPPPPAPAEEEFALQVESPEPAAAGGFELALEEEQAAKPKRKVPPSAPAPAPAPPPAPAPAAAGFGDLVGALEDQLSGLDAQAPPAAKPKAPPAPPAAQPAAAARGGALGDVFAEFKEELEEGAAPEADIETHYNMGVAFKEMNLFDEAIGEFQKAYNAAERIPQYPNFIQCCTLLAHCFLEKKMPELAVKWLERALKAPAIDRDGEMALRYEIGSAHEMAGNTTAALNSFMEVYSLNIDYRDVADRIRALKGK